MFKLLTGTLIALALTGCLTADWIAQTTEPVRGGIVRYPVGMLSTTIAEAYSEDASKKLIGYCHGPFRVDSDAIVPAHPGGQYRYVNFTCKP